MPTATNAFHHRIAVAFDFDETLGPSTYDVLLEHLGEDPDAFKKSRVRPLKDDGWEDDLANAYALIELSKSRDEPVTYDTLAEVGKSIELYDGVAKMFDRLRDAAEGISPGIAVEFYLVTAGFIVIPNNTPIAGEFTATYGSSLHCDEDGSVSFLKRLISHPEKTRYLLSIAKGLEPDGSNGPADVFRDVPQEDWHVPLDQMLFVGDGDSDMPAFRLMNEHGGLAVGVVKADRTADWEGYELVHGGRRVANLAPADYTDGGEMLRSLCLAVGSIAKRVELRKLGRGE